MWHSRFKSLLSAGVLGKAAANSPRTRAPAAHVEDLRELLALDSSRATAAVWEVTQRMKALSL